MSRIDEINEELKIIKECEKAFSFEQGLAANGLETENASRSFLMAFVECMGLSSTIVDMTSLRVYKQKLIYERSNLKNNETKARFEKWLTKDNYDKFIKHLKNKYGNNLTLGFNKHVEEL